MLCSSSLISYGLHANRGCVVLYVCETPEWLHGLQNDTGAYIYKVSSDKWAKYQLWMNYPFNASPIDFFT